MKKSKLSKADWDILSGYGITPDNLSVSDNLDLRGCTGLTSLPDNLSVSGYLDLEGIKGCGRTNRTIFIDFTDRKKCHIGCFHGTREQAKYAICNKYKGSELIEYLSKLDELFSKFGKN